MARAAATALLFLPLLLAALSAHAEEAEAAVRGALARWTKAFNTGDRDGVCDLFAPDLRATNRGSGDRDFDSLCAQLRRVLADPDRRYRYDADIKEVLTSSDFVVVRLDWTLEIRDSEGALLETGREAGMDVFRRQPDGAWRIARFIAFDMTQP
jgi:steroid delta-isomerase